jgi:hypothetical protein
VQNRLEGQRHTVTNELIVQNRLEGQRHTVTTSSFFIHKIGAAEGERSGSVTARLLRPPGGRRVKSYRCSRSACFYVNIKASYIITAIN